MKNEQLCYGCGKLSGIHSETRYPSGIPYLHGSSSGRFTLKLCDQCHEKEMNFSDENVNLSRARRKYYESSEKWRLICQSVFTRDGYTCRLCLNAKAAAIHHLSYAHYTDELLYELISVCHRCHYEWHKSSGKIVTQSMSKQFAYASMEQKSWRLSCESFTIKLTQSVTAVGMKEFKQKLISQHVLEEDLWNCSCRSQAYYKNDSQDGEGKVALACKRCGRLHRMVRIANSKKIKLISLRERQVSYTQECLDALVSNSFAMFKLAAASLAAVRSSWPCQCKKKRLVARSNQQGMLIFGDQCIRCGCFRNIENKNGEMLNTAAEFDIEIGVKFRSSTFRKHIKSLMKNKLLSISNEKLEEATILLNTILTEAAKTLLLQDKQCFQCGCNEGKYIWFCLASRNHYFNCLDLDCFCDTCYENARQEFAIHWHPYAPLSVTDKSLSGLEKQNSQLMLF